MLTAVHNIDIGHATFTAHKIHCVIATSYMFDVDFVGWTFFADDRHVENIGTLTFPLIAKCYVIVTAYQHCWHRR